MCVVAGRPGAHRGVCSLQKLPFCRSARAEPGQFVPSPQGDGAVLWAHLLSAGRPRRGGVSVAHFHRIVL